MALDLYAKGARVWIRHPDIVWEEAEIVERSDDKLVVKPVEEDEGAEEQTIVIKTKEDFPPLKNPDILIGENDLTSLSYLHEPAVLHNLDVRFVQQNAIYTYCGIVLVAINPYARLPIYGSDVIQVYNGQNITGVDPHIYAVAEQAYRQMARDKLNQSVIISGESGAGKTVSAKFAMRYFATVGGAEGDTRIEDKVLASNPVMEALGNAKTTRNDNSSRFGKYIELSFDKKNCIMGANMRTYLLEKTRVVFQAEEERNYHVFYQLCAMRDDPDMEELKLLSCEEFIYTSGGECPVVDSIDDKEEFKAMLNAFGIVGVKPDVQRVILRILAAVLHMGNIQYKAKSRSSEDAVIPADDPHFPMVASLLGVDKNQLQKWLCNRKIQTGREVMVSPLTMTAAAQARDALAKHTYSQLFSWVVAVVNRVLSASKHYTSFIGVLDIYGFEIFKKNSFEQFCINFANEMLQQQFTQHVFKLEQEEYISEQIQWSMIDYADNAPCIELISHQKSGIIAMLDEECKLPRGSDDNWGEKLIKAHTGCPFFKKPKIGRETFFVVHFAAPVEYTTNGFMDKNKDAMNEEHLHLLRASEYALVAELFEEKKEAAEPAAPATRSRKASSASSAISRSKSVRGGPGGGGGGKSRSVGAQFRESLTALMETLNSTTPNYIRCIKPNDLKAAFEFEPNRAVEQLRACGVLETIRISSAGYPSRWTYRDFLMRYSTLCEKKKLKPSDARASTEIVVKMLIQDEDKYQFGKNKVFFRAGQVAYLERLRGDKLNKAGVVIQKTVRAFIHRRKYVRIRRMALYVQARLRGRLARQQCHHMRQTRAATQIQTCVRAFVARKKYARSRRAIQVIQRYTRGMFGRRAFRARLRETKATVLQANIRCWLQRIKYKRTMRGIVLLQSCWRRFKAKQELKKLKVEARSVGKLKEITKGMEVKIIQLQQKVDDQSREAKNMEKQNTQLNNELNKLRESTSQQASSNQASSAIIHQHEEELTKLRGQLQLAETELSNAKASNERLVTEHQEEKNSLTAEISQLKVQVTELHDQPPAVVTTQAVGKHPLSRESSSTALMAGNRRESLGTGAAMQAAAAELQVNNTELQQSVDQMKAQLDEERRHHQHHLKEHNRLQQRFENLQEELVYAQANQMISRSESTTSIHEGAGYPRSPYPSTLSTSDDRRTSSDPAPVSPSSDQSSNKSHPDLVRSLSQDAEVMIRLKSRISELETERTNLVRRVAELTETLSNVLAEGNDEAAAKEASEAARKNLAEAMNADAENVRRLESRVSQLEGERNQLSCKVTEMQASMNELRQERDTPGTPVKARNSISSQASISSVMSETSKRRQSNKRSQTMSLCGGQANVRGGANASELNMSDLTAYLNSATQKENEELRQHLSELRNRIVESSCDQASGEAELVAVQQLATELNRLNRENNSLRSDLRSRTLALLSRDPTMDITAVLQEHERDVPHSGESGSELDVPMQGLSRRSVEQIELEVELYRQQIAALKETNAVLQDELDKTFDALNQAQAQNKQLEADLTRLERQSVSSTEPPRSVGATIDVRLQQEVTRLTSENLDLQEEVERLQSRLTGRNDSTGSDVESLTAMAENRNHAIAASARSSNSMVSIVTRAPKFQGLLKYEPSDEPRLIKRLILEMKPGQMVDKLPCLPATILFMCLRYLDDINDERRVQSLLTTSISGIRKVVKNQPKDVSLKVFWLSNTSSLLTYMKQYSGERTFLSEDHLLASLCLNNFDLTDYRMVLNDLCIFLYQDIVSLVQQKIQPMIVAGMLEHGIPGMWPSKPMGLRRGKEQGPAYTPADIVAEFNTLLHYMVDHCLDKDLIDQVYVQIFSMINAYMLNNMLLRKDLCHLSRGPQIRYNLSQLEEWSYERLTVPTSAIKQLHPITQAAQLLQINKQSPSDVDAIIELCHSLNPVQIQKLLTMYTPTNEFEKRVPATVIKAVNAHFKGRSDPSKLMLDISELLPVSFSYKPIDRDLRDIGVPDDLGLKFVHRL
ncbi:unconventional myosin-Va-like isoform X2 [Sycon ciliatum]|uniref:unconventional myosin-Va-like isoform X2 n=1 Tax=Sycon ciliatum TaxID=27933 RepID=UPI0031F6B186